MSLSEPAKATPRIPWKGAGLRILFLVFVALWILSPFATAHVYGAGDALWYSQMIADFIEQLRAGIFPVFVGQTEHAFNGAVYPLRVAPLYQHVAAVIDWATFHRLTVFQIQHWTLISAGIGGLFSAYLCLCSIIGSDRWLAAILSALYLLCPGVLAISYIQDLHMSWMTLPFLPIAVLGFVRFFSVPSFQTSLITAMGLAGLWLAHAPIAFWMTIVGAAAGVFRLMTQPDRIAFLKGGLLTGLLLIALASYPFVSTKSLQGVSSPDPQGGKLTHPEQIVTSLKNAFPGCLLPLSANAERLSDLQLGYALFLALIVGVAGLAVRRSPPIIFILFSALALLGVLIPFPHWPEFFWLEFVPEVFRRLTYYWPMHRLYLIIATLAIFAAGLGYVTLSTCTSRRFDRVIMGLLCVGLIWSATQAREFIHAAERRTSTAEDTKRRLQPENQLLMNHAYGLFGKLPAYFSNGVMDPESEIRIFDRDGRATSSPTNHVVLGGTFTEKVDANPGILNLSPTLTLKPNQRYDLIFAFEDRPYAGILQLVGSTFFREYALPSSGEAKSFGTIPPHSPVLPLWTSSPTPEVITIRYIPETLKYTGGQNTFASFSLVERRRESSQVQVVSWLPLTLDLNVAKPSIVETPRVYIPGYTATVNDAPANVAVSSNGLCEIAIPAGQSHLRLFYQAPFGVRVSYWETLIAWAAALGLTLRLMFQKRAERSS
ncbi:MAG TPA: hypothetical protein VFT72_10360 [Opitutaceae bacterium]|nr:hypothetical protein [Opitutaceae bacterium]